MQNLYDPHRMSHAAASIPLQVFVVSLLLRLKFSARHTQSPCHALRFKTPLRSPLRAVPGSVTNPCLRYVALHPRLNLRKARSSVKTCFPAKIVEPGGTRLGLATRFARAQTLHLRMSPQKNGCNRSRHPCSLGASLLACFKCQAKSGLGVAARASELGIRSDPELVGVHHSDPTCVFHGCQSKNQCLK